MAEVWGCRVPVNGRAWRPDAGHLRPLLDKTFAFDQTLEALAYLEQGRANGKVGITRLSSFGAKIAKSASLASLPNGP